MPFPYLLGFQYDFKLFGHMTLSFLITHHVRYNPSSNYSLLLSTPYPTLQPQPQKYEWFNALLLRHQRTSEGIALSFDGSLVHLLIGSCSCHVSGSTIRAMERKGALLYTHAPVHVDKLM